MKFTTFARYRDRINHARKAEPSVSAGFVPVVVKAEPSMGVTTASTIEIRLCNGRSIALAAGFDEADLSRLIRLLEALPC